MILMFNKRPKEIYGIEKITTVKQTPAGAYKDVRTNQKQPKK